MRHALSIFYGTKLTAQGSKTLRPFLVNEYSKHLALVNIIRRDGVENSKVDEIADYVTMCTVPRGCGDVLGRGRSRGRIRLDALMFYLQFRVDDEAYIG